MGVRLPPSAPNLSYVAQNVGDTSRQTCGACHFYGGGADAVKHGDLDSSLINPDFALDVHLDADGLNFSCTTCHNTDGHLLEGSRYSMNSTDEETCEVCHTAEPHNYEILNQHLERIACQTCHITEYARGGIATKTWWDWSKAGILDEDGLVDIVAGSLDSDGIKAWRNRGEGRWSRFEDLFPSSGSYYEMALDDLDNDDRMDICAASFGEGIKIWPGKEGNFRIVQKRQIEELNSSERPAAVQTPSENDVFKTINGTAEYKIDPGDIANGL